jgi:hypothetical protein
VFKPEAIFGAGGTSRPGGVIDYRLARRGAISEFRKGRLARHDVCDAHPELRRAALSASEPSDQVCPICEDADVVYVRYVFGPKLPAHGRCITSPAELARLDRQKARYACYVVEVCPSCAWNHLVQTYPVGRG